MVDPAAFVEPDVYSMDYDYGCVYIGAHSALAVGCALTDGAARRYEFVPLHADGEPYDYAPPTPPLSRR
jgi:hypothetical protein